MSSLNLEATIPDELKHGPVWHVYHATTGKTPRSVHQKNGEPQNASFAHPTTLCTLSEAVAATESFGSDFTGVGRVVSEPYVAIDFDHCCDPVTGKIDQRVQDVLKLLHGAYIEISPSRTGLHAWAKGKLELKHGHVFDLGDGTKIEVYAGGKSMTVTGQPLPPFAVTEISEIDLNPAYNLIKTLRDEKPRSNGKPKDTSQSGLDWAVMQKLATKHHGDVDAMEAEFRATQEPREKWGQGNPTYLRRTAQKAAASEKTDQSRQAGPRPLTELGNAERLIDRFGEDVRYDHMQKDWYVWDGKRWTVDKSGAMKKRMTTVVREMLREAAGIEDDKAREAVLSWEKRSESDHVIRASIALAQSEVPILMEDFNKDLYLLSLNNGVLDLQTGEFREHQRDDKITKMSPIDYDPTAKCPRWEQFLREVMTGQNEATIPFLQRAAGYSLTGFTGEHCLFLLYGTGRNGKSVLIKTVQHVLGDYAMQADWQSFSIRKNSGGMEIREDIARLAGSRFVAAIESAEHVRLAENIVKAVTGGDRITARHLYKGSFEFEPQFKLWLATNHLPKITGTDEAIWSRIRLIPFTVTIPPEKRDKHLAEKLQAEAPGILNWALEGLKMYREDGLQTPHTVSAATANYRQESDLINRFFDSCCVCSEKAKVGAAELYAAYKRWTGEAGETYQMSEKEFKDTLLQRGVRQERKNVGLFWIGVALAVEVGLGAARMRPQSEEEMHF